MYPELTDAKYVDNYKIWIKFSNGTEGVMDFESECYMGKFSNH